MYTIRIATRKIGKVRSANLILQNTKKKISYSTKLNNFSPPAMQPHPKGSHLFSFRIGLATRSERCLLAEIPLLFSDLSAFFAFVESPQYPKPSNVKNVDYANREDKT